MYCISAGVKNFIFSAWLLKTGKHKSTIKKGKKQNTHTHTLTQMENRCFTFLMYSKPCKCSQRWRASITFFNRIKALLMEVMTTISKLITCAYKSMFYKSSSNQVQILRNLHHKAEGLYIQWKNLRQTLLASAAEIKHCLIRGALLWQNSTHMHSKSPKQIWVPLSILAFWLVYSKAHFRNIYM